MNEGGSEFSGIKCPWSGIEIDDCTYVGYEGKSCATDMYDVCPFAKIARALDRIAQSLKDIAEKDDQ